jgi:tRNA threonylcarbamoyladenosine biosynthesis protein TsaB
MAIILSIETSTPTSSIAIHDAGKLISSQHIHVDKSHAEYLTLSVKNLLDTSGLSIQKVDAVAVSKGPGSYTGLRIGTSTAKGICYALGAKLIAVNTLEAMAYGMAKYQQKSVLLCPMIDARRMEVYCLIATTDGQIIEKTQAKIIDTDEFSELITDNEIVFFGNGAHKCKSVFGNNKNAVFVNDIFPSAADVGALGWQAYQKNQFEDTAYFEPFYLKEFIAKKPSTKKMV